MKKLLALVFGLTFLVFGTTAFAEFTYEDFARISLENNSLQDTLDMSKLMTDEDGNYVAYIDADETITAPLNIDKAFRRYFFGTYERPDIENYDGSGLKNYFSDYFDDEHFMKWRYVAPFEDGESYYVSISTDVPVVGRGNTAEEFEADVTSVLDAINSAGIDEIYDAYDFLWRTVVTYEVGENQSIRSIGYDAVYFNTNQGEFVVAYDVSSTIKGDIETAELLKLYTVKEFLELAVAPYENAEPILRENIANVDEDGDLQEMTVVETPITSGDDNEENTKEPEEENPEDIEDEQQEPEPEKDPAEQPEVDEKPEKTYIDVILFGKYLEFPDQKPIIENDRVLVPFRVIFEALEADVLWNGDTRTVTATKGDITITLTIGKNEITKNGEVIEIDVPAQIQNSRTLVPIRVVSESFENTVSWDGANRIVEIK